MVKYGIHVHFKEIPLIGGYKGKNMNQTGLCKNYSFSQFSVVQFENLILFKLQFARFDKNICTQK